MSKKKNAGRKPGRRQPIVPARIPVGVVGLGLMGTSIATCLLAHGHRVVAVTQDGGEKATARRRILALLRQMRQEELLKKEPAAVVDRFQAARDYEVLAGCALVVEATVEDVPVKRRVIRAVEQVVGPKTVIGSNTSAIPITSLQQAARHPERILGLHWAEPAHITRFLEIICGGQTDPQKAEWVRDLSYKWNKEPGLVRQDIRGFITNRCFYALLREAFHLVDSGVCTIEDVDRSLRNDLGYWMTLAGPFRIMDLTGIPAFAHVMKDLLPELSTGTRVPKLMREVVESGARGVANANGFYRYTPESAKAWEKKFLKFSYEIRRLAGRYADE